MSIFDKLVIQTRDEPTRLFIQAVRKALKEYDRATRPDGRRNNSRRTVDPEKIKAALQDLKRMSIRQAAAKHGISYGAIWNATRRQP